MVEFERDYVAVARRYPKLYMSDDFKKVVASWVHDVPLSNPLALQNYVHVYCDYADSPRELKKVCYNNIVWCDVAQLLLFECVQDESSDHATDCLFATPTGFVKYNSKIVICSGFTELLTTSNVNRQHLWSQLKFLMGRERGDLLCLGGLWSKHLDGLDPNDSHTLIRTATYVSSTEIVVVLLRIGMYDSDDDDWFACFLLVVRNVEVWEVVVYGALLQSSFEASYWS